MSCLYTACKGNAGDKVEFSEVLMVSNDGNITVGNNA
jgi:ribosomal protein L21